MQIRVFDGQIKTGEAELAYIVDRIGTIVGRAFGTAAEVEVRLSDINGPRGGFDKRCAILVSGPRVRSLRIEKRAKSYYDAIDAAAATLRRALSKSLERAGLSVVDGRIRRSPRRR